MAAASPDRVLRLPDGRLLGYGEYGDPAGRPLLLFHGLPGSRMTGMVGDEAAKDAGVRLLCLERPGYGLSDFQKRRRVTDWPADVAALADALELDRFAVAGLSGGGPYAAACAWALPARVSACGIISGVGPFQQPDATEGMGQQNRVLFRLAARAPFLVGLPVRMLAWAVKRAPRRAVRQASRAAPEPDRIVLERDDVRRWFMADSREAFRHGTRGTTYEVKLLVKPWGFPLEGIRVPVHLWQGLDDENVPPAMGRYQARVIPNCHAEFIPGAGHLWVMDHAPEVLAALCP